MIGFISFKFSKLSSNKPTTCAKKLRRMGWRIPERIRKKWEKGVHFQIIITTFGESVLSIIIKHYNYEQKAIWAFSKPIFLLCN